MTLPAAPSLFISHGAPDILLGDSPAKRAIRELGSLLTDAKGVVVVSAHWIASPIRVTAGAAPETLHDFGGSAPELRRLSYPAPGSETLSNRVLELLDAAAIEVAADPRRGWDHGVWIPLMLALPEANAPVVQVSLPNGSLAEVVALGKALAPLRREGIAVIGSGGSVHNLRALSRDEGASPEAWAASFDEWLRDAIEGNRFAELSDPARLPDTFLQAHPSPEHFAPILLAWAAGDPAQPGRRLHQSFTLGNLGLSMYRFGEPAG